MISRLIRLISYAIVISISYSLQLSIHRISALKHQHLSRVDHTQLSTFHDNRGSGYTSYYSGSQLFAYDDDTPKDVGKKSIVAKAFSFVRNIIAASVITFFSINPAWARRDSGVKTFQSKEKRAQSTPMKGKSPVKGKSSVQQPKKETPKKLYEVILEVVDDSKDMLNSDLLNKVGIGAVGLTVVGALIKGDDKPVVKSKKTLPRIQPIMRQEILSDLKSTDKNSLVNVRNRLKDRLKSSYNDPSKLPDIDSFFENEETADTSDVSTKSQARKKLKSFPKEEASVDETKEDAIASTIDPPPTPVITPTPSPPPAPAPQKVGFFDRIFKRKTSSRPTNVDDALRSAGDQSYSFRMAVIEGLVNYVRPSHIDEWAEFYSSDEFVEEKVLTNINKFKDISGLSPQEAADAFAEVANAMLVKLVDTAVDTMDRVKNDNATTDSVAIITDFIGGAGSLFSKCLAQVTIEPVQYTGKVKKGKLEDLYYIYAKTALTLPALMSLAGLMASDESSDESSGDNAKDTLERLGRLQQVFGIKESKQNNILQRIFRESMMNVKQDDANLGGMFDSLKGGDMSEIMNALGGMPGMPGLDGAPPDFEKELENMSEADKMEMAKLAVNDIKQSLKDGTITKDDVAELEKQIGFSIKEVVKNFDSGRVDKRKLAELGPEYADMINIFREIAKL